MNRRGQVGDMVELIPRILMLSVIAVVIFGVASVFYGFDISVRDAEARILGMKLADCLSGDAVVDLDEIGEGDYNKIVSYCGIGVGDRVYVGVEVFDSSGVEVVSFSQGDSGLLWVRDLFEKAVLTGNVVSGVESETLENMVKYNPGYYEIEYPVFVSRGGGSFEGKVKMEVLVNNEE